MVQVGVGASPSNLKLFLLTQSLSGCGLPSSMSIRFILRMLMIANSPSMLDICSLSQLLTRFHFSAFARIENHYFVNEVRKLRDDISGCNNFFPQGFMRDGQLLEKQSVDKM